MDQFGVERQKRKLVQVTVEKKFFGLSLNFDHMLSIFHKRIVEFDVNTNYLQSGTCCYYCLLARVGS